MHYKKGRSERFMGGAGWCSPRMVANKLPKMPRLHSKSKKDRGQE